MNRLFLLITALLLSGCIFFQHPLEGRWKSRGEGGTESMLYFKGDGTFEALSKGEKLVGKWTLDEEVEPNRLELQFEEQRKVVTIARILGDQLILEPREEGDEMPTKFSESAQKFRRQ